jgi:peptide-methionine (S)-S-oxide reductase
MCGKRAVLFLVFSVLAILTLLSGCIRVASVSPAPRKGIPLLDVRIPSAVETASFALGWFWGSDAQFGSIEGVIRTRVGYAGGITNDPTYYRIGDHSETVQVDYDPTVISYGRLLEAFWNGHDPSYPPFDLQYRSAIFYVNEEQKNAALESLQREKERLGREIYTAVEEFDQFYVAEDYHQKYYLRGVSELLAEYTAVYPDTPGFLNSTAAARVNGYIAGYGDAETLKRDLDSLGLSNSGKQRLLKITDSGLTPACPVVRPQD